MDINNISARYGFGASALPAPAPKDKSGPPPSTESTTKGSGLDASAMQLLGINPDRVKQGKKFADELGSGKFKGNEMVALANGLNLAGEGDLATKLVAGKTFADELGSGKFKGNDMGALAKGLNLAGEGNLATKLVAGKTFADELGSGKFKGNEMGALAKGVELVGEGDLATKLLDGKLLVDQLASGKFKGNETGALAKGLDIVGGGDLATKLLDGKMLVDQLGSGKFKGNEGDALASGLGLVGNGIGGEVGNKALLAKDALTQFGNISTNTIPGAATGNIIGLGLDMTQLLGLKIDPGVSSLAGLGASLATGNFLGAGIQLISSLLSMGDHNKTVDLQKAINATGRIMGDEDGDGEEDAPTDTSSLFDHTNTGFLSIGSSHSSSMQYETTGRTIDPRLLKDVEFKIEERPSTGSGGLFSRKNENAGKMQLTIKANYDGINPATGGATGETKIDLSPEQVQAYKTALGGESGKIDPKDLQKMAVVQPQLNDMKITFKQKENDPTLYNYKDVNGDGIPDRIGISLNNDGLEKKGDGSVSITILDKNRNAVGDTLTANGSSKIEDNQKEVGEMLQLRPLLETYAASHIETWDGGKDLTSTYRALKANGGLEKMKQIGPAMAEYAQARQGGEGDVLQAAEKVNGLVKELGFGFDARAYAAANPDLIKNIGTDPSRLAEHYRNHGNFEGRALNLRGDKAPQWIPPALRGTTVLGSEINAEAGKNAEITRGQSLVSNNGKFMATMQTDGNFCVYDISGKDKKLLFDAKTNEQRGGGLFGGSTKQAATSLVVQADGNLVAYDANHSGRFYSDTGTKGVNRAIKLSMNDNGNLDLKDSQGGGILWSSGGGFLGIGGGKKQPAAMGDGSAPVFKDTPAPTPVTYGNGPTRAV